MTRAPDELTIRTESTVTIPSVRVTPARNRRGTSRLTGPLTSTR